MTIWCGQDGSFNDAAGDGPADLDGLDEEVIVGWQDPFTDWNGHLFEGMGQYGVYTVTDPWEPATFPAVPYPFDDEPSAEAAPAPSHAQASPQRPESPLDTPAAPQMPTAPHFGPPAPGGKTSRRGPSHGIAQTSARGTFTGFDFPFTDDDGALLMDPHPAHQDWMQPMTYGDPVMTGWDTPLTDLEGQLLSGPGQYGTFTMEDPYDHRNFNEVDLEDPRLEGNPFYYYTGAGDAGQQAGQAFGSMLGSATGEDSKAWGEAGGSIATSIEQGSDSGDWGSAVASIAAATAKVAIPAIVKAATSSSSSSSSSSTPAATTTSTPASTTPAAPSTTTPSTTPASGRSADPRHIAMSKLLVQLRKLAPQYGIQVARATRAAATSRNQGASQ